MKRIEIGSDIVIYHYKDEAGNTTQMAIQPEDITCIERDIDKGKDKGKLVINPTVTLFWSVSFE